jgi:hypothetical protein
LSSPEKAGFDVLSAKIGQLKMLSADSCYCLAVASTLADELCANRN